MILSGVVMALSMKRRHFVEKREFLSGLSTKIGHFVEENVAAQADMTRDKQICEREISVCVYRFVAMGLYLMISPEGYCLYS